MDIPLNEKVSARTLRNRLNGAKSRGPVTPEGKAKSAQNARKHGLSTKISLLIPPEQQEEFTSFSERMNEALRPADEVQGTLAQIVIQSAWRLRLFIALEADLLRDNLSKGTTLHHAFDYCGLHHKFAVLNRYQTSIERSMYKALEDLRILQGEQALSPHVPIES